MATKTCLHQSHRLTATYFRDGKWVASCSCAEYMSWPYTTPERAMNAAVDEHYSDLFPDGRIR